MKIAILVGVAAALVTSIPLLAQEAGASAQENSSATAAGTHVGDSSQAGASANAGAAGIQADDSGSASEKATYAATAGGFGDQSWSHAWEMSSISGELDGKLNSKTAKPGDPVVLKTIQKVQTSDGTIIPRGSRLMGHVTQAQAYSKEHGAALLGIAFDRVELKGGQSVAIYTLIRGMTLPASAMAMNSMDGGGGMGAPMDGGGMMAGGPGMGGGHGGGGMIGGAGGAVNGAGNMGAGNMGAGGMAGGVAGGVGGVADRTGAPVSSIGDRAGADLGATENAAVETAGHGDTSLANGAHAAAAARAVPRPTGIPGVMLSGSSSASGLFVSSAKRDIQLEGGMQMQLGIVAKD